LLLWLLLIAFTDFRFRGLWLVEWLLLLLLAWVCWGGAAEVVVIVVVEAELGELCVLFPELPLASLAAWPALAPVLPCWLLVALGPPLDWCCCCCWLELLAAEAAVAPPPPPPPLLVVLLALVVPFEVERRLSFKLAAEDELGEVDLERLS